MLQTLNPPMRLAVLAALLVLTAALPAVGQERAPGERQTLLDLSYALGQVHALRQVCEGPDDQYWRDRMMRLTEVEAADEGFDGQMKDRFNAGFATGQSEYPTCGPESRRAMAAVAARGRALAGRLSRVTHVVRPEPQDDPYAYVPDGTPQTDSPH